MVKMISRKAETIFYKENSKSIYSKYLLGLTTPVDYGILRLNSKSLEILIRRIQEEKQQSNQLIGVDNNFDTVSFNVVRPNSNLNFTHKMNILKSIVDQDVLKWIAVFKETTRICNWDPETHLEVLNQIIDVGIHISIGPSYSSDEILHKILKKKYNVQSAYIYQCKLNNIKQSNFYTIMGYYTSIELLCNQLGACNDWNMNAINDKIRETF
ncbi:hypothetical protein DMUE_3294 [Dictyocoela muelleri]|nr:hypothetical protein DMUE_3294 [Dictyocoela muelleri]